MPLVHKILVPVDFSSGSKQSVEYAAALSVELRSTITLLHVYQLPDLMSAIVPGADNAADVERERTLAQSGLESLRTDTQKKTDTEMAVLVAHGSPADEILSLSRAGQFDMIVMGTHGRTGLQRLVMGSVAETVVRRAHCPVLTIHLPLREVTQ